MEKIYKLIAYIMLLSCISCNTYKDIPLTEGNLPYALKPGTYIDVKGNVHKENESEHLAVAYGNIVGVLIEAIKELKLEIDELKNAMFDDRK